MVETHHQCEVHNMASLPESVSENLPGRDNLVRGEFLHELGEKLGKSHHQLEQTMTIKQAIHVDSRIAAQELLDPVTHAIRP
jgi:hypothetical protein